MSVRLDALIHAYHAPTGESRRVLDIPDWTFADGAQALLRGISGSGKTTLFNVMAGLLRPTQGAVYFDDLALYDLPEAQRDHFRARSVGYVFQNHLLIESLTALENVVMPLAFARHTPRSGWDARARDLLAQVGLADFTAYKPRQLSTGQCLRVAVARALANQPRVVLADEPTASLDSHAGETVIALLKSACAAHNTVLIVASHDPAWATCFDQHFDLRGGQLSASTAVNHAL